MIKLDATAIVIDVIFAWGKSREYILAMMRRFFEYLLLLLRRDEPAEIRFIL